MSSGTPYNPGGVRQMLEGLANRLLAKKVSKEDLAEAMDRVARMGMSPRQQELNRLWAWYRCEHYATRKMDWNGQQALDPIEHEAVATSTFIPPGFYDGGQTLPLKFRRPSAPYALVKVIVDRFTGLLFSERRHPQIRVDGDPDTQDFMGALAEVSRIWPSMIKARTYGGAMGTVAVGFQFLDGAPLVEVHDTRWTHPEFEDRHALRLSKIEKRYMYPVDERDPYTGIFQPVWYWYRRVIDKTSDVLFEPCPVGDGQEPQWIEQSRVEHGLGFCPVVWIQNLPVEDDIDGDPDARGVYELVESMDMLIAQAHKGTLANCDPTVVVTSAAALSEIKKGSDNAIRVPDGDAKYMEMQGAGIERALEVSDRLRSYALEVAQCVLEHPNDTVRTATEVDRSYSSMFSKADVLREQYGEKGVKPLLEMMVRAARKLGEGSVNPETGQMERQVLKLPPRFAPGADGEPEKIEHELGDGGQVKLQWPGYFEPRLDDVQRATQSAILAKTGGLVDQEHATNFVAEYFHVEDVHSMLKKIESEKSDRANMEGEMMMRSMRGGGEGGGGGFGGV